MVACNHDSTSPRWFLFVDAVLDSKPSGLDGVVQDGGVFVVADAAKVDDAVGGEHVLCSAGGVLGATAGDEFRGVVV